MAKAAISACASVAGVAGVVGAHFAGAGGAVAPLATGLASQASRSTFPRYNLEVVFDDVDGKSRDGRAWRPAPRRTCLHKAARAGLDGLVCRLRRRRRRLPLDEGLGRALCRGLFDAHGGGARGRRAPFRRCVKGRCSDVSRLSKFGRLTAKVLERKEPRAGRLFKAQAPGAKPQDGAGGAAFSYHGAHGNDRGVRPGAHVPQSDATGPVGAETGQGPRRV